MLNIWPELHIYIVILDYPVVEEMDNLIAAPRLNHRVSRIRFHSRSDLAWETFASLMQQPFPALTDLWVDLQFPKHVISPSFLGGSAPCLRALHLDSISFPALPNLLLSATNLVRLSYGRITSSGYIPLQEMVAGLSALTRLESLSLTFICERELPTGTYREIRISPSHTRTLLPALTDLHFLGFPEYMEDLVAQIDAPLLESMEIALFHERVLEVPQLAKFVCRADKLSLLDRAKVTFKSDIISVFLSRELEREVDPKTLWLDLSCLESLLRLSYLTQCCASYLATLSPLKSLRIGIPHYYIWKDVIDEPYPQWLGLLRLFDTVQGLYLSEYVGPRVVQALRGLPAERVMEVLPALETVSIARLESQGRVKDAISEFADARQLSGHPIFINDWEGGVHYWWK